MVELIIYINSVCNRSSVVWSASITIQKVRYNGEQSFELFNFICLLDIKKIVLIVKRTMVFTKNAGFFCNTYSFTMSVIHCCGSYYTTSCV